MEDHIKDMICDAENISFSILLAREVEHITYPIPFRTLQTNLLIFKY